MLALAQSSNREVALLYDSQGKPNTRTAKYTRLCLFASAERHTLKASHDNKTQVAAHIELPEEVTGRYQYLVHTHPTMSPYSQQLIKDNKAASEQVEIVITLAGKIFYYNEDCIFNKFEIIAGPNEEEMKVYISNELKSFCNKNLDPYKLSLDEPITLERMKKLTTDFLPPPFDYDYVKKEDADDFCNFEDMTMDSESEDDMQTHSAQPGS